MLEELKKHNKKQNIIAAIILVVGILFSIMIFGSDKSKSLIDESTLVEKDQVAKLVKTVTLESGIENVAMLEKTIYLDSVDGAMAIAEYSGRIKNINFEVGQYVKEGEILAIFDQSSNVNSAKISLDSAERSFVLAQKNLKETKKIVDESLDLADDAVDLAKIQLKQAEDDNDQDAIELAEENLDIAKTQEDKAEASAETQINGVKIQLEQARLGLEQARIGFNETFIKAPISGYIASKEIAVEDYINSGQSVAEIVGSEKLQAEIYLNADEVERIRIGDLVYIYSGENEFQGGIQSVSEIANNLNQRFEVQIEISNGLIKNVNQNAKALLMLHILDDGVYYVPLDAVNIGQTKTQMFVVNDSQVKAVEVKTGKIIGNKIEVKEGLNEGDEVVIEGNRSLRDGSKVDIRNDVE